LNPYQKEELLLQSSPEKAEMLNKLSDNVSIKNMYNFSVTYDRHKNKYDYKEGKFPPQYEVNDTALNYANDPDWSVKLKVMRFPLKKILFFLGLFFYVLGNRVKMVEEFDRRKRKEQRAM
jgi:hypothetical protein